MVQSIQDSEVALEKAGESALYFGPFRIEAAKRLWRGEQLIEIRPRPLAMLRYLAERPRQLVTKEELLKRLWPGVYVTKTVLKVCAREIRQALGDDAATPQYIETVGAQGYRFIGAVVSSQEQDRSWNQEPGIETQNLQPIPSPQPPTPYFVGRARELAMLQAVFAQAQTGKRQVVFISGEAGIGKTTLVDRFLDQLRISGPVRIGRGQCIEQHGVGEAYLPILEALSQLCSDPGGERVIALLRRYAPMWVVQLPGMLEASEVEALQRQMQGSSRERMLREFVNAIDRLTADAVLVLVLEDLQWSDPSTIELLASLTQRRGSARVCIVGTYRSADVVASGHPLRRLVQELHGHGQCEELALELLTEEEVAEYLERRFPNSPAGRVLSAAIYNRADGNALFTVSFVDYLLQQGRLVEINGRWELQADLATLQRLVPKTVQRLIAKQVEELSKKEQQLLEVASVSGMSFTAAEVAGVTGHPLADIEEAYEELAGQERFIEVQGISEGPDRTLTARYQFRHALVQHVVYERIGEVQRVRLHRQLGERLATAYGEQMQEITGELAMHFEQGRDYQRAVRYYQQAAETALRRHAYQEAQAHLTQGLTLLQTLPETPAQRRQELALRVSLNAALVATRSLVAPELEQNLQRARELCRDGGEAIELAPIIIGLTRLHMVRAERMATEELMEQQRRLIAQLDDPAILLQLHTQLGTAEMARGAHARSRTHHAQVLKLYDPTVHAALGFSFGVDPLALALAVSGVRSWLSGWPAQAWTHAERGIARAQELEQPFSLVNVLAYAVWVRQFRGELDQAWKLLQTLVTLEREYGFSSNATRGTIEHGYVLMQRGEAAEGVRLFTEGLAQYRATGSRVVLPHFLSLLAEMYGQQGQVEEGLKIISEAIQLTETNFDRFWAAEVYRIKGELTLQQFQVSSAKFQVQTRQKAKIKRERGTRDWRLETSPTSPQASSLKPLAPSGAVREAEECFHQAIEIARQQEAKSLELRAVLSLAQLWRSQGKKTESQTMLGEIYGWFTEGFDTADLREAKQLLAALL